MPVTEAQKRATTKYEKENYDKVLVRFPKGTKERIQNAGAESVNGYIVKCVLNSLETPQTQEKRYKEPTKEELQALQALIDEKRAKQKEQEEIVRKAHEQRKTEEKAKEAQEVNKIIDRIINGEELEEDEEKEKLRQESIIKNQHEYY